ncbi:MAG: SNF2-related protein [Porphyromonas sp.]|nr:SNF2-related protein [Porphyromonas sp.]
MIPMTTNNNHSLQEIALKAFLDVKYTHSEAKKALDIIPTLLSVSRPEELQSNQLGTPNELGFVFSFRNYVTDDTDLGTVTAWVNFLLREVRFEVESRTISDKNRHILEISAIRGLIDLYPTSSGDYTAKRVVREFNGKHTNTTVALAPDYTLSDSIKKLYYVGDKTATVYELNHVDFDNSEIVAYTGHYFSSDVCGASLRPDTHCLDVWCECRNFREERHFVCTHIRALLRFISDSNLPRFFDPAMTEERIKQTLKDKVRPAMLKLSTVTFNESGKAVLVLPRYEVLDEPENTNEILGFDSGNLKKRATLSLKRSKSQSQNERLLFAIRWKSQFHNPQKRICHYPDVCKGRVTASGKLSATFMHLDLEKVGKHVFELSQEAALDAISYIRLSEEFTNSYYWDFEPSYTMTKGLQAAHPLFQKYPVYLYTGSDQARDSKLTLERMTELTVHDTYAEVCLDLINEQDEDDLLRLQPKLRIGDKEREITLENTILSEGFVILDYQDMYLFSSPYDAQLFNRELDVLSRQVSPVLYRKKDLPNLYESVIKPLGDHVCIRSEVHNKRPIEAETVTPQIYLSDAAEGLVRLTPAMQYGNDSVPLSNKAPFYDSATETLLERDYGREEEYMELFRSLHPDFENTSSDYLLTGEQLIENNWLIETTEKLRHKGVQIYGADNLKSFRFNINTPSISISTSSGIDWFDLKMEVKFGKQVASLQEVKKSVMNKSQYVMLSDGTIGILPEKWLEKYAKYFRVGQLKNKKLEISLYQFNIIDQLYEDLPQRPKYIREMMERKQRLQDLSAITSNPLPEGIQAELRPYQKSGYDWLLFLNDNQLGGCLADDMGLGKTLQVITLLQHLKEKATAGQPVGLHLIVLPTSLLFNWQKELQKFAPGLDYLVYSGGDRSSLRELFPQYDLILSTYGVVSNDIEELSRIQFEYVILDESQAIKNPFSKRYKSVRLLQAKHRLALTGTPIENNTFDLYAQMNFLNPGIFGSMDHFRQNFSTAIDKYRDREVTHLLRDMTQPFLLRRTKKQVATELPEKTETVLYCEMKEEQRKVYDSFKEHYRQQLLTEMEEKGEGEAQMMVLQALTKLRQICNSPQLIATETDNYTQQSIKLDLLIRNIRDVQEEHKVLVFSQFTSMLSLIRQRLESEEIRYVYLDGATTKREEVVTEFQENDEIRVFLISLKAGGTGLNLTAADYVFLVDPWWNPAVENQAIDRSYRIGQEKHVNAYRMVCKDTIEEKILQLQESKRSLSEEIIQVDGIQKSFSREDIAELFK